MARGGGDAFIGESAVSIEAGYRATPAPHVSVDVAVYRTQYRDLRSAELPPVPAPIVLGNSLEARASGVELMLTAQPAFWWRTTTGYAHLRTNVTRAPGSRHVGSLASEANDPRHLATWRNAFDLGSAVEADVILRAVGSLPEPAVPRYLEADARLGWLVTRRFEIALVGQDLLHSHHPEFGPAASQPRRLEFERSVRVGLTVRY